ncbi:hypothetical protein G6M85_22535 [Agrobacterium tumefaciens]|uniref:hypothetical protein n=1 Tax=Agrobacterium tumefaciens TaxID=358 RepID=UPI0015722CB4|nr:hypothetical protein [Agrobacterium tumefaciens]NTE68375.1 hypothetical protein [Agrobacterium tumefaciens]
MSKKHSRKDHPCLSCPLPDCDDGSPKCLLRKALSEERTARSRGVPLGEDLKRRRSIAYNELYYWERRERERLRSEGAARLESDIPVTMAVDDAEHCLRLWSTKKFDTSEIARFLSVHESVVCRTIQAARDIVREGRL